MIILKINLGSLWYVEAMCCIKILSWQKTKRKTYKINIIDIVERICFCLSLWIAKKKLFLKYYLLILKKNKNDVKIHTLTVL
jgi:hypothetical protein